MRYFADRQEAGRIIAEKLKDYKKENCVVVSLTEGGVVVGAEIAKTLHTALYLLVMEDVALPGEQKPLATMSSAGTFTYNNEYSTGELEALNSDYRSIIEEKRVLAFQKLNRIGDEGTDIPKQLLKNHTVIIVSDGFRNGLSIDVTADFLKPIKTKEIIIATPVASVEAVDKMHLVADKICCLGTVEEYVDSTDHYYKNNQLPKHQEIVETMRNIILNW
ncbi:MAG TPA: phosphoribosyltransferase family protein [Candidatus Saccharimonadales bacterium]|nr:phosphoribosyltransferase family protein [Candidatus Saccharimonadales bacterium]